MSKYVIEVLGEFTPAEPCACDECKQHDAAAAAATEHATKTLTLEMLKSCRNTLLKCGEPVKTSGVNEMPTPYATYENGYDDGFKQCEVMVLHALKAHVQSKLWGPEGLLAAMLCCVNGYAEKEHTENALHVANNELRECNARLLKERDALSKCWKEAVKLNGTLIAENAALKEECAAYNAKNAELRKRLGTVESMKDQIEGLTMLLGHWDKVQSHTHENSEDEVVGTYIPAIVLRRLEERNRLKNLVIVLQGKLDAIKEVLP